MRIKPAITFLHRDSDLQLIADIGIIMTAMTGNRFYPNPTPPLDQVSAALTDFSDGLTKAAGGGVRLTAAKNEKRAVLTALVRNLAAYVLANCNGSLSILLSSGFPIQKPKRQPVGHIPAPKKLTLSLGARSGELDAQADPVRGACIYNWRLMAAAAPTVALQTGQSTGASRTFTGLTPGVVYVAQVNAVVTAGPTDWTQSAPQMAV